MPLLSSSLLLRTHSLTLLTFAYYLITAPPKILSSTPVWLLGESMSVRPAAYATEQPGHASSQTTTARTLTPALVERRESEREIFALLAVALVVYAVTQFLFAGDLSQVQLPGPTPATSQLSKTSPTSSSSASATSRTPSSRYGEELHTLLAAQSRWLSLTGLHVLASSAFVLWIYVFHSHSAADQSPAYAGAAASTLVADLGRLANRVTFTVGLADMLFWGYLWTVLKEEGREVGRSLARRRQAQDEEEEED